MQPIQELLNRIRWDPEFAAAAIEIGYYDRLEQRVIRVALKDIWFEEDDHFGFELADEKGGTRRIPFHRIRDLYRDGRRIWHRPAPPA